MYISRRWLAGLAVAMLAVAALWLAIGRFHLIGKSGEDEGQVASNDIPVVIRTNGGLLEVATVKHRRAFNLTNALTVFGMKLPFCKESASFTVDAAITYRVRLARRWRAEFTGGHLDVTAPRLEPSLPVAFDTSRLAATFAACRFFPDMDTRTELLRSISGQLAKDAASPRYVQVVREDARRTVAEFVGKWLVNQRGYAIPAGAPVDVAFADED